MLILLFAIGYWALLYPIVIGLGAFGKVIYLSLTFNDCSDAANSLKKEIVEARLDLTKKGFNSNIYYDREHSS